MGTDEDFKRDAKIKERRLKGLVNREGKFGAESSIMKPFFFI